MHLVERKKFYIEALGCRTNQYEGQAFADALRELGYEAVTEGQEADVVIVNTCSVTSGADSSSRAAIRAASRRHPHARIFVTGCSAERDPEAYLSLEGVAAVVPNAKKEEILKYFAEKCPEFAISRFDSHTRAFVKVQDGCNSFCSYCIIPYVRGRSRSRPLTDILREAKRVISNGHKEIVLTGINVGDYKDEGHHLSDLVSAIDTLEGLRRLRISSIDPDDISEALQAAILDGRTTCPSMHISLQSGSNAVLQRMRRKYTAQVFCDVVRKLKEKRPDFTVTTDIIVGFPGESIDDFEKSIEIVRDIQFAKVHIFPYSDRPGTLASKYEDKILSEVINARKQKLLEVAEETAYKLRSQYVGKKMTILTEEHSDGKFLSGYTENFLPVYIDRQGHKPNEYLTVDLVENRAQELFGRVVS